MISATILMAAIGYGLVYAAMPNRDALRSRSRADVRRPLAMGVAALLLSAVLGAIAIGPVIGPFVACAAALAAGSVLVLFVPLMGETPRSASLAAAEPAEPAGAAVREAQSVATRAARDVTGGERLRS